MYIESIYNQVKDSLPILEKLKRFKERGGSFDLSYGNPLAIPFLPAAKAGADAFLNPQLRLYTETRGLGDVRDVLAEHVREEIYAGAVAVDRTNVIPGSAGATALYHNFLQVYLKQGDVFAVPAPGYGLYSDQPKLAGAQVVGIPLKEEHHYRLNAEDLDKTFTEMERAGKKVKAYLLINPHNPTGAVLNPQELKQLAAVFKKHDIFVIEDMAYRDTTYELDNRPISLVAADPEMLDRTLTIESLSKSYGLAGARIGYAAGSSENIAKVKLGLSVASDSAAIPQQMALAATFDPQNREEKELYLKNNAEEYQYRAAVMTALIDGIAHVDEQYRKKITAEVAQLFGPEAEKILSGLDGGSVVVKPESGFFMPVKLNWIGKYLGDKKIESAEDIIVDLLAEEASILTLPGKSMMWPTDDPIVRMSLVPEMKDGPKNKFVDTLTTQEMITGIARLHEIRDKLTDLPNHNYSRQSQKQRQQ